MIKIQMISGKSVFIENATCDDYDDIIRAIVDDNDQILHVDGNKFVLIRNIEVVEYIEQKGTV